MPRKKAWFLDLNFNSYEIKTLNRLRSGHCQDKKTLAIMKLVNDNKCETCNDTVEDSEHIIKICPKYTQTRNKYPMLKNKNYNELL